MRARIACGLLLACLLPSAAVQAREACAFLRDPAFRERVPVAPAPAGTLAFGTLNLFRLFDAERDGREEAVARPEEFSARIGRIARYVAQDMGAPLAVAVQEVEDDTALAALARALQAETGRRWHYVAGERSADGDIRSGLLLDARLGVLDVQSLFMPRPYARGPRFDRPPLAVRLDAGAIVRGRPPLTLVVVHLRSMRDIDDPQDGARVLEKRRWQARELAAWVRARGQEPVLVLGDFNAPVPGTDARRDEPLRILVGEGGLVDPGARFLRPAQRWTYRHRCTLDQLDHALVTPALSGAVTGYVIARGDTCLRARERCSPAHSVSDHEGVVIRLR